MHHNFWSMIQKVAKIDISTMLTLFNKLLDHAQLCLILITVEYERCRLTLLVNCRSRIVKEEGIAMIEHYLYEEHERLRQAAMECMCNMVLNEEVRR